MKWREASTSGLAGVLVESPSRPSPVVGHAPDGYNSLLRIFSILPIPPSPPVGLIPSAEEPPMRFCLLDRICSYEADQHLTAVKNVSLSEEYLADHFPEFPVLPGVFMIEAATQSAAWLVRLSEDFAHSIITLAETRSVRFVDFVTPGKALRMSVQQTKRDGRLVQFKFRGEVEDKLCVAGRLALDCANLADDNPEQAVLDQNMIAVQRSHAALLTRDLNTVAASA